MIDLDAVRAADVEQEPFTYFVAHNVLHPTELTEVRQDFPDIRCPGVFPLNELSYGQAFSSLIDDIRSHQFANVIATKLDTDLSEMPLMITVRGYCQKKDGRIHTDSKDKIVTCLLYLNDDWSGEGGRLRLLKNGHDLEDMITEVPPNGGTLVVFKRSNNSWHGHHPFEGPRRYVMFNWVRSEQTLKWNIGRHALSARFKKLVTSKA